MSLPERACVEQAVEEERPERIVGSKQDEIANLPAPDQATGGPLEPEFLEAAEGQVGDDVELDPAVVCMVVDDEEGMRSPTVTREAKVGEWHKSLLEPQEVRRWREDVHVLVGRVEFRLPSQERPGNPGLLEGAECPPNCGVNARPLRADAHGRFGTRGEHARRLARGAFPLGRFDPNMRTHR
jgi:hypothetical protein